MDRSFQVQLQSCQPWCKKNQLQLWLLPNLDKKQDQTGPGNTTDAFDTNDK
jgi:hypothetical protein